MSKLILILIISAILLFTVGISLFLSGCHEVLRPNCFGLEKKAAKVSQYPLETKKCALCANLIQTSEGEQCEAFKHFDCFTPKVILEYKPISNNINNNTVVNNYNNNNTNNTNFSKNNIKNSNNNGNYVNNNDNNKNNEARNSTNFCTVSYTQETFDKKETALESAEKAYPRDKEYKIYFNPKSSECKFAQSLETLAIVGLVFLLLFGVIAITLLVLFVKRIVEICREKKEKEKHCVLADAKVLQNDVQRKVSGFERESDKRLNTRVSTGLNPQYENLYEIKPMP